MSKKRQMPREIRIGQDRFIPIVMQVITKHPDGTPNELFCPPSNDYKWHLPGMERPEFVIVFGRDVTFPGINK